MRAVEPFEGAASGVGAAEAEAKNAAVAMMVDFEKYIVSGSFSQCFDSVDSSLGVEFGVLFDCGVLV